MKIEPVVGIMPFLIISVFGSIGVQAKQEDSDSVEKTGVVYEGSLTTIYQAANDDAINGETFASLDFGITAPVGKGEVFLYVEGNTNPAEDGPFAILAEAKCEIGTALDRNGDGRVQISELHYSQPLVNATFQFGLIDVGAGIDTSEVANDETTQFTGASFVHNLTIEFPDYTLGVVFSKEAIPETIGWTFVVAGSNGLGDNPEAGYAELFDIDEPDKGVFIATQINIVRESIATQLGLWGSTADQVNLAGTDDDAHNNGIYLSMDGSSEAFAWNLRMGKANDDVATADRFAAIAFEKSQKKLTYGLGLAKIWLASDAEAPGLDNTYHTEIYGRFSVSQWFDISSSLQWIKNSGFDSTEAVYDDEVTVVGVRAKISF